VTGPTTGAVPDGACCQVMADGSRRWTPSERTAHLAADPARRVDVPIEALVAEAGDSADNPIAVAIGTDRGL
jgi:hypothetical protein